MATYNWFKIFNLGDFPEDIESRTTVLNLEGIGETSLKILKGNITSISVDGFFIPIGLLNNNPFKKSTYASYVDENNDVWLGYEIEE